MSVEGKRPGASATQGGELELGAPPRLLDDAAAASELREDLRRTVAAVPAYDVAAGLLALKAAIAASAAATASSAATAQAAASGSGAAAASAKGAATAATAKGAAGAAIAATVKTSLAVKLAVSGGVALAAVAATLALQAPKSAPMKELPSAAAAKSAPVKSEAALVQPELPAEQPTLAALGEEPALAAAADTAPSEEATRAPSEARAHAPRAATDGAAREIAQLARIKAALAREPRQALELAEAGHREFRGGYLHHEREALAILALQKLGRTSEARDRAQRFLRRYPHGPMSERVREQIGEATP